MTDYGEQASDAIRMTWRRVDHYVERHTSGAQVCRMWTHDPAPVADAAGHAVEGRWLYRASWPSKQWAGPVRGSAEEARRDVGVQR